MIEVIVEIIKNSPQWVVGIALLIIVIGWQFRFNRKQRNKIETALNAQKEQLEKSLQEQKELTKIGIINTRKIGKIEDKYILKAQMKHVEDYLQDIEALCLANCRHFLIKLKRCSDDNINKNESYMQYSQLIRDLLMIEVKSKIREEFEELREKYHIGHDKLKQYIMEEINGDFVLHKQKTIQTILSTSREYMSKNWINTDDISRKEGLETIDFKRIEDNLNDSFNYAMQTLLKYYKEIRTLENEIK